MIQYIVTKRNKNKKCSMNAEMEGRLKESSTYAKEYQALADGQTASTYLKCIVIKAHIFLSVSLGN